MDDFYKRLKARCPNLFREDPRCGFWCPPGWFLLVQDLSLAIEAEILKLPEAARSKYVCAQIKQKFGGLRFYMEESFYEIDKLISEAEGRSIKICDVCGSAAEEPTTHGGWMRARCAAHKDVR